MLQTRFPVVKVTRVTNHVQDLRQSDRDVQDQSEQSVVLPLDVLNCFFQ